MQTKSGMPAKKLADDALDLLTAHHWPGNVRELENLILRLVVLIDHAVIEAGDIRPILGDLQHLHQPSRAARSIPMPVVISNAISRPMVMHCRQRAFTAVS